MHDTAFRIGSIVMETYADVKNALILEIGALDVNGSLRSGTPSGARYVGLDIEEGEGVDIVIEAGGAWPVEDECFDLVMATSVFEHDSAFWDTFLQMCRKTKLGGHIYVSAPSNGRVHRFPQDLWRFYPDAGLGLEALTRKHGLDIALVESFIAERSEDEWNDFCAVFRRGPGSEPLPTEFVYERIPCTNVLTWQSKDLTQVREQPEDQVLLLRHRQQVERLEEMAESERRAWNAERILLARAAAEGRIALEQSAILVTEGRAQLDQEIQSREYRIADLKNNLRQRQEEITQAWSELDQERAARAALADQLSDRNAEVARIEEKLRETDAWIYRLAGERREAEQLAATHETERAHLRRQLDRARGQLDEMGRRAEETHAEAADLRGRLRSTEAELSAIEANLVDAREELERFRHASEQSGIAARTEVEKAQAAFQRAEAKALEIQSKVTEQVRELAILTTLLRQQEGRGDKYLELTDWVVAVNERLTKRPRWWSLMPTSWRSKKEHLRLRRMGLFDGEAYLMRYPDVAKAGLDPLNHYLRHGMHEDRSRALGETWESSR